MFLNNAVINDTNLELDEFTPPVSAQSKSAWRPAVT